MTDARDSTTVYSDRNGPPRPEPGPERREKIRRGWVGIREKRNA